MSSESLHFILICIAVDLLLACRLCPYVQDGFVRTIRPIHSIQVLNSASHESLIILLRYSTSDMKRSVSEQQHFSEGC